MKLLRGLILVCLCFFIGAPHLMAGEIERIQAQGEIVVSLNNGYPPFAMMVDGQPRGLDVDLARLLADDLGVKVRFIRPELYDQQIPRLLAGESDIIVRHDTHRGKGTQGQLERPLFRSEPGSAILQRQTRAIWRFGLLFRPAGN